MANLGNAKDLPLDLKALIWDYVSANYVYAKHNTMSPEEYKEWRKKNVDIRSLAILSKDWDLATRKIVYEPNLVYNDWKSFGGSSNRTYHLDISYKSFYSMQSMYLKFPFYIQEGSLVNLSSNYPNLLKLVIDSVPHKYLYSVVGLVKCNPQIHDIKMLNYTEQSVYNFLVKISQLQGKSLKILRLDNSYFGSSFFKTLDLFPKLPTLQLSHYSPDVFAVNNTLVQSLPQYNNISNLKLDTKHGTSRKSTITLSQIGLLFPNLECLVYLVRLEDTPLPNNEKTGRPYNGRAKGHIFQHLEYLNIVMKSKKDAYIVSQCCPKLRTLILTEMRYLDIYSYFYFRFLMSLKNSTIEQLTLQIADGVEYKENDIFLAKMETYTMSQQRSIKLNPSNLIKINMSGIKVLDIHEALCTTRVFYVLQSFPCLKKVDVYLDMLNSSKKVYKDVRLPSVVYLELELKYSIGLNGWIRLLSIFPNVKEVKLHGYMDNISNLIQQYPNVCFSATIT